MKISELSWPMDNLDNHRDDLLIEIKICKVALLVRGRNAWHSTWVKHYFRNSSLHFDVEEAKKSAEKQRERGNVFYIYEAPAIQLIGQTSNVVLCDAHPENPFENYSGFNQPVKNSPIGKWIGGIYPGTSVYEAVATFNHESSFWSGQKPDEASLRSGRMAIGALLQEMTNEFQNLKSEAIGTNYLLNWNNNLRQTKYVCKGAQSVVQNWEKSRAQFELAGMTTEETADVFHKYLTDELACMTEGQWQAKANEIHRQAKSGDVESSKEVNEQSELVDELIGNLEVAEENLEIARTRRLKPAATSEGIRKQRENFEKARDVVERLSIQLDAEKNVLREKRIIKRQTMKKYFDARLLLRRNS